MKKDYLVTIHGLSSAPRRLGFARWQIVAAAVTLVVGALVVAVSLVVVVRAQGRVHALSAVGDEQQRRLETIGKQAQSLDDELRRLQTQNQQIRRLLGVDRMPAAHARPAQHPEQTTMNGNATDRVAGRLTSLVTASQVTRADADHLRHIALRVLNIHRMQELLQARVIAAVPSIDPVEGASIASAFGWRIDPWPSFHAGVDLDANYGDEVRAAAAGTVVSAGWDGGYGLKVDIDHHNGYHTWYAHLSRADVQLGQYVRKAEPIALVGESGDATGPHLHYQIMYSGHAIDPAPFLSGVPAKVLASLK